MLIDTQGQFANGSKAPRARPLCSGEALLASAGCGCPMFLILGEPRPRRDAHHELEAMVFLEVLLTEKKTKTLTKPKTLTKQEVA